MKLPVLSKSSNVKPGMSTSAVEPFLSTLTCQPTNLKFKQQKMCPEMCENNCENFWIVTNLNLFFKG